MKHQVRSLFLAVSVLSPAAFADVLVVDQMAGPGSHFTNIQAAVNAASDGDFILVRPGTYPGFSVVGKDLAISAEYQSRFQLAQDSQVLVQGLAPDQNFHLRGADDVDDPFASSSGTRLHFADCAGWVWIEDCHFDTEPKSLSYQDNTSKILAEHVHELIVQRCELAGGRGRDHFIIADFGYSGLWAYRVDSIAIYDSVLLGGNGGHNLDSDGGPAGHGGAGLRLESVSNTVVSGSQFAGGNGGSATGEVCWGGAQGGHGIEVAPTFSFDPPNGPLALLDIQAEGGPGGFDEFCGVSAPFGLPVSAPAGLVIPLSGVERTLQASSPAREGSTLNFRFTAQPGDLALFLFGGAAQALPLWIYSGALQTELTPAIQFAGVIPASSQLVVALPIPNLKPSVEHLSFVAQGLFLTPSLEIRLGGATLVTLVDATF